MSNNLDLLKPAEAAKRLGISTRQLGDITTAGRIRFINVGNGDIRPTRRYTEIDIEDYIEANTCQYSKDAKPKPTPTTSSATITDIRAIRDARQKRPQKSLRKN